MSDWTSPSTATRCWPRSTAHSAEAREEHHTTHTLFGYAGSGSAAIEVALEMAAVPYRLVQAASWDDKSALAQLARANPLRQIPTLLLPDGAVLTESAAILIHLGLSHPLSGLLPKDAAPRAQAIRALVYIAANCYSAISIVDYPERWLATAGEAAQRNLRDGARRRLHAHWEVFADTVAANPFLGGAEINAADVFAATISKWSGTRQHLRSARPAFHAVLEAIDAHPRVAPVFARHWPT